MHKLTRNFILIGLLSMGLAALVFGYAYQYRTSHDLLRLGEVENTQFGTVFRNFLWSELFPFVDDLRNLDNKSLRQHHIVKKTGQSIRANSDGLKLVQVSVFALNGNSIFSTELRELGSSVASTTSFQQAKAGSINTVIERKGVVHGLDGMLLDRLVAITYMPILSESGNNPEAVMMIMSDLTDMAAAVDKTVSYAYLLIGLIFTGNFLLFLSGIHKVRRYFKQQNNLIKQQQDHIEYRHSHDSVTQLPKLNIFYEALQQSMEETIKEERLLAVLILEMDRLQKINDTLGYKCGDDLLIEASLRLQQCVRKGDMVSRLGGDKFIMMLTNISVMDEIEEVVTRVQEAILEPYYIAGTELFISPSIGGSVFPFNDDDSESLIRNATSAMYKAKSSGKNVCRFYNPEVKKKASSRFSIENSLRYALERDEFELHYQPVILLAKQNVYALEALIRWRSPEWGFVAPLDFIPLLEETGLIVDVGRWVLEKACLDAVGWHNMGFENLRMNVNVSAVQFLQGEIVRQVDNAIAVSGISPYLLDLEITESMLIDGADNPIKILERLNNMGVSLSIDDFGTGYSSLAYLKQLPVNTLKIDRSFINDVTESMDDAAIVEAICTLSQSMRFKVLAEGVETAEHLAFLRHIGVDAVQGYFFSRPLPADQIAEFLSQKIVFDKLDAAV